MTELLASADQGSPPGRFLSLSALQFDPGDLAELHTAWDWQLPAIEVFDAVVATKHKEVLSPNLPLAWRVPAVDGYDGGLLPLRNYSAFAGLLLGGRQAPPDGRLRENLKVAPAPRLLSMMNARFLITDKIGDVWIEDVYYDRQLPHGLAAGEEMRIAWLPDFRGTSLRVLTEEPQAPGQVIGHATIETRLGHTLTLPLQPDPSDPRLVEASLVEPAALESLAIAADSRPMTVLAATLVDERTGAFHSLALEPYRLAHSGDVKVYENLEVLPRALAVGRAEVIPDDFYAMERLNQSGFDSARTVILASGQTLSNDQFEATVEVLEYSPALVRLSTDFPVADGYLVLSDAYYPGWRATVDGDPVPILRADVMFRAVYVPQGEHMVEFSFVSPALRYGLVLSLLGLVSGVALLGFSARKRRSP